MKGLQSDDRQERQYLLLYLTGLPDPVRLAIAEEDVAPFRNRLFNPAGERASPASFYWLSSFDGKEVLISLPDVAYVNFLFEIEKPMTFLVRDGDGELETRVKADQYDGTVDLYFRQRPEPVSIRVNDSLELKQVFEALAGKKAGEFPSFVSFADEAGEVVALRPDRLILLVAHRGSVQMTSEADYERLFRPVD
jgi:hypothetical protein